LRSLTTHQKGRRVPVSLRPLATYQKGRRVPVSSGKRHTWQDSCVYYFLIMIITHPTPRPQTHVRMQSTSRVKFAPSHLHAFHNLHSTPSLLEAIRQVRYTHTYTHTTHTYTHTTNCFEAMRQVRRKLSSPCEYHPAPPT
jgi:hypothetical protein